MSQTDSTTLFQRFTSLTEGFVRLSTQLSQTVSELQDPGLPPSESLLTALADSRRDFADLCAQGLALAAALEVTPLPTPETLGSLSDVKLLLQAIARAEDKRAAMAELRQCALAVLDRVLAINHRDHATFAPLLECQERARTLRHAIAEAPLSQLHPATEALAEGEDPFSDLLTLVGRQEELSDDDWSLLQDTVEQAFGKPLAVAASRGKLTIPEEIWRGMSALIPKRLQEEAVPVDPPGTVPGPSAEPLTIEANTLTVPRERLSREPQTQCLTTTADAASPSARTAPDAAFLLFPLAAAEESSTEEPGQPPHHLQPGDATQHRGAPASNGLSGERPTVLRDLIWRLLFEDKISFAFHIARYVETQYPESQSRVPSWLLRAVLLGRHVRHAHGEIARLLKEDFTHFNPVEDPAGPREWSQAIAFLWTAAALQPALLAPSSGAPAILRALQLPAELNQLAAYCRIIAEYGDKLQPLDPTRLKKGKDQATWQAEVDALQQAVELWWSRAPRLALAYAPAARVWGKWLEPKGLVHSLLFPVRQNELSKLPTTKGAVKQLSDDAQLKREVEHTDRKVLGRRLGDDITGRAFDQLRLYVREAVGFARRWIELQESAPSSHKNTGSEPAEQVRQEVWGRQGAVLEELGAFKRRNPSLLTLSGIACCRRALENVHTLFDPEALFPTEEPLPGPLLHADLLRIPSFELNDQWEIEDSRQEALVNGILDLVMNGVRRVSN